MLYTLICVSVRSVYIYWHIIAAYRMLKKLTPVVNFFNILGSVFTWEDSTSTKRYWQRDWIFTLLGSACVKATHIGEIDTWFLNQEIFAGSGSCCDDPDSDDVGNGVSSERRFDDLKQKIDFVVFKELLHLKLWKAFNTPVVDPKKLLFSSFSDFFYVKVACLIGIDKNNC